MPAGGRDHVQRHAASTQTDTHDGLPLTARQQQQQRQGQHELHNSPTRSSTAIPRLRDQTYVTLTIHSPLSHSFSSLFEVVCTSLSLSRPLHRLCFHLLPPALIAMKSRAVRSTASLAVLLCSSLSVLLLLACQLASTAAQVDPNTLLTTGTLYDFESPSVPIYQYNPPVSASQPWSWLVGQGGIGEQGGYFDPPGANKAPHNVQVPAQTPSTPVHSTQAQRCPTQHRLAPNSLLVLFSPLSTLLLHCCVATRV